MTGAATYEPFPFFYLAVPNENALCEGLPQLRAQNVFGKMSEIRAGRKAQLS
jgi:hypothetical protein